MMKVKITIAVGVLFAIYSMPAAFGQENEQEELNQSVHDSILQSNRRYNEVLARPAKFDYFETRFADVIDELKTEYQVPFVIDESAIENNLDEDQLITLNMAGVSLRSGLRIMLQPYQCTYLVADEVIYIMSADEAVKLLETRIFDCRQIIDNMPGDATENAEKLAKVIRATVDSKSWDVNGGRAAITEIGGLLVTTQTASNQMLIEELVDELEARVTKRTDTISAGK